MKKKTLLAAALLLLIAVTAVYAWPGGNWVYAIPGLNAKIKFWVQGNIDLISGETTVRQAGTYRVTGDRLTITFRKIQESALSDLSGVTAIFKILENGDFVDQLDGTTWVRIE